MSSGESKGLNGWTKWLVGVLFTIIFTAITTLTNNVIANDDKSRTRDSEIRRDVAMCIKDQMIVNQQILVSLAEIKTEIGKSRRNN